MVFPSGKAEVIVDDFSPFRQTDRTFDIALTGEVIRDSKGRKVGKVIGS